MKLYYVGDLFPSMSSYKKGINKYDKGIKG